MSQINLKMHINEQIITKLCGEFKCECLRKKVIVKGISYRYLKGMSWQAFLFSYQCVYHEWWGGWKGVGEKTEEDIDLVHNKYNTILNVIMMCTFSIETLIS